MLSLCEDLGIPPEDLRMLVLAHLLNAQKMGYFTEEEFTSGLQSVNIGTIDGLRTLLDEMANIQDILRLRELFYYAFQFGKRDNSRIMTIENAIAFLKLIMKENCHTDPFCKYLEEQSENKNGYKAINFDQWKMYFEFATSVASDFSNYNDTDAWPLIIDMYVENMTSECTKNK